MIIPDPIFILSPPLSSSSLVAGMLGQHPQMYVLPETHLLLAETLGEWWKICTGSSFDMAHGLLRAVAEIELGGQTEEQIELAAGWLRRRLPVTTGHLLEALTERVHPRAIVEKSPSIVFHLEAMRRADRMFPQARFIHLVQHPQSYSEAVVLAMERAIADQGSPPKWLRQLASFSSVDAVEVWQEQVEIDPRQAWQALNRNICAFLTSIPEHRRLRVRSEDLLELSGTGLRAVAEWLGVRTDEEAMEAMRHPERSPYACFGPPGARYGDDPAFLASPCLPAAFASWRPDGPVSWCPEDQRLTPDVENLAGQFGYA